MVCVPPRRGWRIWGKGQLCGREARSLSSWCRRWWAGTWPPCCTRWTGLAVRFQYMLQSSKMITYLARLWEQQEYLSWSVLTWSRECTVLSWGGQERAGTWWRNGSWNLFEKRVWCWQLHLSSFLYSSQQLWTVEGVGPQRNWLTLLVESHPRKGSQTAWV